MKGKVILVIVGTLTPDTNDLEIKSMNQNHKNNRIVEISWNDQKCSGNLRRLAISLAKDHQLRLVSNDRKE